MRAKEIRRYGGVEADEASEFFSTADGITVECICPKCGLVHRMKLLWAGRGRPKKFCQPCKAFIGTLETVELHGMPAAAGSFGNR